MMLHLSRWFWRGSVLAALSFQADAREPKLESGSIQMQVRPWTTDNGLPMNRISCLKQTRDGYLWVGTWAGLARFDGLKFTIFNQDNTSALSGDGSVINGLGESTDGTLWIATKAGLFYYQGHEFSAFPLGEEFSGQKVWRVAPAREGGLWLHVDNYLTRIEKERVVHSRKLELSDQDSVLLLCEQADGWLSVFTLFGWFSWSPTTDGWRTNFLSGLQPDAWLAGFLDAQTTNPPTMSPPKAGKRKLNLPSRYLDRMGMVQQDDAGNRWFGLRFGGLYRAANNSLQAVEMPDIPSVICMEQDREGSLWLGTETGLLQVRKPLVRSYPIQSPGVFSVCESTDSSIWAGAKGGLYRIRSKAVERFDVPESHHEVANRCVWPNRNGGIWFHQQGVGIREFQDDKFFSRRRGGGFCQFADVLYQDHVGRLWVGMGSGAVAFEVGPSGELIPVLTNSFAHEVRSILQDRTGALWFGTSGHGLARVLEGNPKTFTEQDGLPSNTIWSLQEDADGIIWAGTRNGLVRYRAGRFFAFTGRHGLQENNINCVLVDDFGCLWLSGLRGLYRFERSQLNAVAEGRASTAQCYVLRAADGMESSETNGGENQPAGWKASDGRLWFPTIKGVVCVDPKDILLAPKPPQVVIERVKADEQVVFGDDLLDRFRETQGKPHRPVRIGPRNANVVEFQFTANTFVAAERARFQHRLIGPDLDSRQETSERTVRYINLHPGHYRFEITAADHHNVWNPKPQTFEFSVAPFFWQTWPSYLVCAAGAIGIAAAVQNYRLRWQRRLLKLEEQRALASERARIARELHDDLGTALTGLALELDVTGNEAKPQAKLSERLGNSAQRARDLAEHMREVVWSVNPKCDTVSSLVSFLEQQVSQFLRADGLKVRLDFPEDVPDLPLGANARHQLALAVREALTNVVRHAQASHATVRLEIADQRLVVKVEDNGRGVLPEARNGDGLENMRRRLEDIGGGFDYASTPGMGTTVTFKLPLNGNSGTGNG